MMTIAEACIDPDHPALAGHFPGNPIVPGVLILSKVLEALDRYYGALSGPSSWPAVKFIAPLHPGERFAVAVENHRPDEIAFSVIVNRKTIALGTMRHHRPFRTDVQP